MTKSNYKKHSTLRLETLEVRQMLSVNPITPQALGNTASNQEYTAVLLPMSDITESATNWNQTVDTSWYDATNP